jgi:hypothetical protein
MSQLNEKEIAAQLVAVLTQEALNFVKDNQADVIALGPDIVKALMDNAIYEQISIPKLPVDASIQMISDRELLLAKRASISALIAKAQLEDSVRLQKLQKGITDTAIKIASIFVGVGIDSLKGLLIK